MRIFNIATTLTNISELYISEAAEMPFDMTAAPREKRKSGFVRFMNSGWGVAMICALVAVAVTVGIIAAGQAADPVTILPGAGPTHPNFSFDYTLDPAEEVYRRGDSFTVETKVKNLGLPFTVTGGQKDYSAVAWLVPHGTEDVYDPSVRINASFAYPEDYIVQTIDQGDTGTHSGTFTIPEDAALGLYDLVLAYGTEYQVFEKALTIIDLSTGEIEFYMTALPEREEYPHGATVTLGFVVTGLQPLSIVLESGEVLTNSYALNAVLTPHGYTSDHPSAIVGTVEWNTIANQTNSNLTQAYYTVTFTIPEDAKEGPYDLCLQYVGEDDTEYYKWRENILSVSDTHPRLDFSYYVTPYTTTFLQGNTYEITTTVINVGEAFIPSGTDALFYARAKLVHREYPDTIIECAFDYNEISQLEISAGQRGTRVGRFTIPADATTGEYDLWLSCGEEYQVFEKAFSIEDPAVLPPLKDVNFYDHGIFKRLQGFTLLTFKHRWGLPSRSVAETNTYIWELPDNYDFAVVTFSAEGVSETITHVNVMKATVTKRTDAYMTVQPCEGEVELLSCHAYDVSLADTPQNVKDAIEVGTIVYVSYTGAILETFPCHFENQEAVTLSPPGRTHYAEDEAKAVADAYMAAQNLPIGLDRMLSSISVSSSNDEYVVSYDYLLGGLPTAYRFILRVSFSGIVTDYQGATWDDTAYYATYTDAEIEAARERLSAKVKAAFPDTDLPAGIYYFDVREGGLYLNTELILGCDHENGEKCLIGHHHYMYEEQVIREE